MWAAQLHVVTRVLSSDCAEKLELSAALQQNSTAMWLVLWFTVLKILTVFLSPTHKLSSCLSSERRHL